MPISGPIHPVVDRRGFTGSAKDRLAVPKQTWPSIAPSLVRLDSARVWLSCYAINWISVLVRVAKPGFVKSSHI